MKSFNDYTAAFSKLRTDRGRDRFPAQTLHRAPHKPFLLLSIIDLVAQRQIRSSFIEPSYQLGETFNGYWSLLMPVSRRGLMSFPYYFMRSEPFWKLIPNPGHEDRAGRTFSSMTKIREVYAGARIDDALYRRMLDPVGREVLRAVLVKTYFDPAVQPQVAAQGVVNLAAYDYAGGLKAGVAEALESYANATDEVAQRVRDQGFRKAIVSLYDHRCALCGIRMLTPDGHTVVEAAHIVPWSKSKDDRPTNGLCLCRLCHWSFDEGLMGVGKKYEILVSKRVRAENNMPGHILTLLDRPIFTPEEECFRPTQDNLARHRKEVFVA